MSRRKVQSWAGERVDDLSARGKREVVAYGVIDSTNSAALELAEDGASAGTVVVCREQTAGRGRGERKWHSPPGTGLYLSMILRPRSPVLSPLVSILAGLGVVASLDRAFPGLDPALKWPNDIVRDGSKLGGVLAEAVSDGSGPRHLVVGVGLNVKSMARTLPRALKPRTTWIEAHVPGAELPAAADAVVSGLERWLRKPPATLDAGALDLLDRYDWRKNRRVEVTPPGEEAGLSGVATGIAPDGALLFRPDRGALRRIASATVVAEERA